MVTISNVISDLEDFNDWVERLHGVDDNLFFTPIKEEKWTPAEIISHITYWDRYILEEMLPKMKHHANVDSVDFEVINNPASDFAMSGVSKKHLIQNQIEARTKLVSALKEKKETDFLATFTLNGEEIDEYSGYPHSLYNYLSSFVWHDNHHKAQIETFLHEKNSIIKTRG